MSTEELITKILNHLSDRFREHLVLKGGILLRLHNSPRYTQDLDYVLRTKESKKIWKEKLLKALEELPDIEIEKVDLNSRGIFIDVKEKGDSAKASLEISVAPSTHLPPEPMSTAALSQKYSLVGRVITTMALPEAYAHKIAATLERDVIRDVYDLSQLAASGFSFDLQVLRKRLSALAINRAKPKSFTFPEASEILQDKLESLDQKRVELELYPLLPSEFRPGVLGVIRSSVGQLIQRLQETS